MSAPAGAHAGWSTWGVVVGFAVAMAWLEAAVVLDLRSIAGQLDPYPPIPWPAAPRLMQVEAVREGATLLMLAAVGWLAGRTWRGRMGYGVLAFGTWDIFYYVFLAPLTGWPRSLGDWDILFLLPLPWWGPVWAPVLIATLMVLGGTLLGQYDSDAAPLWPRRWTLCLNAIGSCLALYVFMADALKVVGQGTAALGAVVPVWFNWPLFLVALVLMALPVADLARQVRARGARGTPRQLEADYEQPS